MSSKKAFIDVFDQVTGVLTAVPLENYLGVYSVRNEASEGPLMTDATVAIQTRIDDARTSSGANTSGAIVLLQQGIYLANQLRTYANIDLTGVGVGTEVRMFTGTNVSFIVSDPATQSPTSFLHHAQVRNMRLRKSTGTDTLGSAIEINCRVGERCRFEDLLLSGWPQSGIRFNRGGQPVIMRDVHAFQCGEYGVDLRRTSGDVWHMVSLDGISGDNHGKGLIHLDGLGAPMETVSIKNIKAEKAGDAIYANTMPCVIDFDRCNSASVHVENLGFYAISPGNAVFRISSSSVRIVGKNIRAVNTPYMIEDIPNNVLVPYVKCEEFTYDAVNGFVVRY